MRRIRIGTRGSRLALIQTEYVEKELKHRFADVITERVIIHTEADKDRRTPLYEFKGTGVFAKELESALLEDRIDIAVHSAKDMSVNIPDKLTIAGALEREDVRDVLVYRKDIPKSLDDIKQEITIGTDSPRRKSQIEKLYPLIKCESIRGNVPTRIAKVKNGEYDGALLAVAGLKRLGLLEEEDLNYHFFSEEEILSAGGQGIIAIETRKDDDIVSYIDRISDKTAFAELMAEQRILKLLNAGCHEPIAVRAKVVGDDITITIANAIMSADNKAVCTEIKRSCKSGKQNDWENIALAAAREIR